MTTHEILESLQEIGMPLPIDLSDPKQKEELDRRLAMRAASQSEDGKSLSDQDSTKAISGAAQAT